VQHPAKTPDQHTINGGGSCVVTLEVQHLFLHHPSMSVKAKSNYAASTSFYLGLELPGGIGWIGCRPGV